MALIFLIALSSAFAAGGLYLYGFFRLYGIVKMERPDWLQVRGSLSFLYEGLSRAGDPNVQVEVLRVAFGSRASQLQDPAAIRYAQWIRVFLPSALTLFVVSLAGALAGAP